MLDLGNGVRILRSAFRGVGPGALAPDWGDDLAVKCAVLVADVGWVPCARDATDVEREARGRA